MRQGDIITEVQPANTDRFDMNTHYLVITHCCSLARKDPVELLPCQPLPTYNGNMTNGKNPRTLHFLVGSQWYEVKAYNKILYESQHLEETVTVYTATEKERNILQQWLSLGYRRHALNTVTNKMVRELKLKKIVNVCGKNLHGVWISPSESDETADGEFSCDIYFVFDSESSFSCYTEIITNHISKPSIQKYHIALHIVDDRKFSYYDTQHYTYINLDYLSTEE